MRQVPIQSPTTPSKGHGNACVFLTPKYPLSLAGMVDQSNPLALPEVNIKVPHEPPSGWRERLYADSVDDWVELNGGPRPKAIQVPGESPS